MINIDILLTNRLELLRLVWLGKRIIYAINGDDFYRLVMVEILFVEIGINVRQKIFALFFLFIRHLACFCIVLACSKIIEMYIHGKERLDTAGTLLQFQWSSVLQSYVVRICLGVIRIRHAQIQEILLALYKLPDPVPI